MKKHVLIISVLFSCSGGVEKGGGPLCGLRACDRVVDLAAQKTNRTTRRNCSGPQHKAATRHVA